MFSSLCIETIDFLINRKFHIFLKNCHSTCCSTDQSVASDRDGFVSELKPPIRLSLTVV